MKIFSSLAFPETRVLLFWPWYESVCIYVNLLEKRQINKNKNKSQEFTTTLCNKTFMN